MTLKHINHAAIAEARQGIPGDCQADQIIRSVEYSTQRYLLGDSSDGARIARLAWQVGALQGEIRRLCRNYAEVVEPMVSEDDDGEVGEAANDWKERAAEHDRGVLLARIRAGKVERVTASKLGDL